MMEQLELKDLIRKYIEGTASQAEQEKLINWYRSKTQDQLVLPYENEEEEDESRKRILNNLLSDINREEKPRIAYLQYVKIAMVAASLVAIIIFFRAGGVSSLIGNHKPAVYDALITRTAEHKVIILSDGSKIWLGAESELLYPREFNGRTREVSLSGEAFFEVAKDKKHPFIVHTDKSSTEVLGTSFNINALKNRPNIKVSLISGKVKFTGDRNNVVLQPGKQVVFNKIKKMINVEVIPDINAITDRRKGYYEYNNALVGDIVDDINLNFNSNIVTQGNVKNCRFFGRLKPGESMDIFLTKLCKVTGADLIKTNNGYLIKGRGCN